MYTKRDSSLHFGMIEKLIYGKTRLRLHNDEPEQHSLLYWCNEQFKNTGHQHREKLVDGFTKEFNCVDLVYYEDCGAIYNAIVREKQIKGKTRAKKIKMIMEFNPKWKDLYDTL